MKTKGDKIGQKGHLPVHIPNQESMNLEECWFKGQNQDNTRADLGYRWKYIKTCIHSINVCCAPRASLLPSPLLLLPFSTFCSPSPFSSSSPSQQKIIKQLLCAVFYGKSFTQIMSLNTTTA